MTRQFEVLMTFLDHLKGHSPMYDDMYDLTSNLLFE